MNGWGYRVVRAKNGLHYMAGVLFKDGEPMMHNMLGSVCALSVEQLRTNLTDMLKALDEEVLHEAK